MNKYLKIFFFITLLAFFSCSVLTKYSVLIDKKSDKWERKGTCQFCESFGWTMTYDYKYNKSVNENLSISICPSSYGFTISFGPPLVPVIPNPRLLLNHHWKDHPFFVDILFGNFNGKKVNLKSVKFIFSNKSKELKTDSIIMLSKNSDKKIEFVRRGDEEAKQKISDSIYQFEQDTTRLRFYFNYARNKVHRLAIDFSKLQVNDSIVSFPEINYVKRSRFLYDPLVIGH